MINEKNLLALLENFEQNILEARKSNLENLSSRSIVLYGAGNIGKKLYRSLKNDALDVECFIDCNVNIDASAYEIPIYHPESKAVARFKECSNIILSGLFALNTCNEIKKQLSTLGFKNVFALHEVQLSLINGKKFYEDLFNIAYNITELLRKDREKIITVFSLLKTEQDRELYFRYLKAHLIMNFSGLEEPYDIDLQYLAHDIPLKKNYSNFIDCGGFDGDTLRNLMAKGILMNNIAVFEPQNFLCQKIAQEINENKNKFDAALVFPCGVHSKIDKLRFSVSNDALSVAKIDEMGDDIIQCVAIDDVLKGFHPTFIKMDIEGAEIEALKGARNTIIEDHPQLAICVYHSLSDLWEIPLLINSFYDGYKFYLRSYNFMGFETVLYAFPE